MKDSPSLDVVPGRPRTIVDDDDRLDEKQAGEATKTHVNLAVGYCVFLRLTCLFLMFVRLPNG